MKQFVFLSALGEAWQNIYSLCLFQRRLGRTIVLNLCFERRGDEAMLLYFSFRGSLVEQLFSVFAIEEA